MKNKKYYIPFTLLALFVINSILVIDTLGEYRINIMFRRNSQYSGFSIYKSISDYSFHSDTIRVPKLLSMICALHSPEMRYSYCDTIANGYIEEYYYNGKIRFKGEFINGCPQGILLY